MSLHKEAEGYLLPLLLLIGREINIEKTPPYFYAFF
jgi:hypothetical protein